MWEFLLWKLQEITKVEFAPRDSQGQVGYGRIVVLDENVGIGDVFDNMTNNTEGSLKFSLDFGMLYDK